MWKAKISSSGVNFGNFSKFEGNEDEEEEEEEAEFFCLFLSGAESRLLGLIHFGLLPLKSKTYSSSTSG